MRQGCGWYSLCGLAHSISCYIYIFVAPPKIEEDDTSNTNVTVTKGGSTTLTCDVKGDPLPTITWTKDGIILDTDSFKYEMLETGSLLVHDVSEQDGGEYVCEAENDAGSDSKDFILSVKGMLWSMIITGLITCFCYNAETFTLVFDNNLIWLTWKISVSCIQYILKSEIKKKIGNFLKSYVNTSSDTNDVTMLLFILRYCLQVSVLKSKLLQIPYSVYLYKMWFMRKGWK